MANVIYSKFFEQAYKGLVDFDADGTIVRAALERSTSSYTPNKDHDFMSDLSGFVEIDTGGYLRQTVANKLVELDDANDRVEFKFDNINFSNLASGQIVRAIILYVQIGGSDATPSDDPLICYIDTATGLPATLGGGQFLVTINSEGLIQVAQG